MQAIELRAGLTIQRGGVAVNINFTDSEQVFVSRHGFNVTLPHNCLSLERYPQAQFQQMMQSAIENGATLFHAVGSEDLPLPLELISEEVLIIHCPKCHAVQEDHDGLGVLYCEACGYCTHASASGEPMTCDFCGANT